jgi:hypothetical protein
MKKITVYYENGKDCVNGEDDKPLIFYSIEALIAYLEDHNYTMQEARRLRFSEELV